MKKPRFDAFPTIKQQPKPVRDLHSPLDDLPTIVPPNKRQLALPEPAPPKETADRPDERTYARTPVRRTIRRYAFEFFADQLEELKDLSLQEKMQGKPGSMSEMVRAAIDSYLQKRRGTAK